MHRKWIDEDECFTRFYETFEHICEIFRALYPIVHCLFVWALSTEWYWMAFPNKDHICEVLLSPANSSHYLQPCDQNVKNLRKAYV